MTNGSYQRGYELLGCLAGIATLALFVTAVVVIVHFVAKFW